MEIYKIILVLTAPVFVGIIINEYKKEIFQIIKLKTFDYDIVVGVLSARSNNEQRNAIRSTWMNHLLNDTVLKDRIIVKFIVGDRECDIHPADRVDQLTCQRWNVSVPDKMTDVALVAISNEVLHEDTIIQQHGNKRTDTVQSVRDTFPITHVSFQVHHPVVVTKLGVLKDMVEEGSKVKVSLRDGPSQIEIAKTVFTSEDQLTEYKGFVYKTVAAYVLPKDFEGVIQTEANSNTVYLDLENSTYTYNKGGGVLSIQKQEDLPGGHYRSPREWKSDGIPAVSCMYSIHEVENLHHHISGVAKRDHQWMTSLIDRELRLREEIDQNDDILLVETVDVYRNIPQKVLLFHQWAVTSVNFKFLLKTDDDCYVDLEKILHSLDQWKEADKLWWGRFRYNWAVDQYGKWAEDYYLSPVYPAFACGSGNVLSKDLVQWIVNNMEQLHTYQGEDVSLGIWLAAVYPEIKDDPLWQCEPECISDMYTMPDVSTQQLNSLWASRIKCGDPCGCE